MYVRLRFRVSHIEAEAKLPPFRRRHFQMDFLEKKCMDFLKISFKFVHTVRNDNIPALVQIMAWRRPGDKPSSEPMMISLLTHVCTTRPQWVIITFHRSVSIRSCLNTLEWGTGLRILWLFFLTFFICHSFVTHIINSHWNSNYSISQQLCYCICTSLSSGCRLEARFVNSLRPRIYASVN